MMNVCVIRGKEDGFVLFFFQRRRECQNEGLIAGNPAIFRALKVIISGAIKTPFPAVGRRSSGS